MENQKKDVIAPTHLKKELDASALDTLIEPLDELDLGVLPMDEIDADEI
ncbi:hypothetical protein [uncultured Desulfosarcina sp.]|nr:hypothetical protein [uncultured Desulfosarcina sp.]